MKDRPTNLYINRELSWLEFNARVLEEALDETVPLLERLKFLSITSSNLDEFFMVRVSGIKRQIEAEVVEPTPDRMTPQEADEAISDRVHQMVARQYSAYNRDIRPRLAKAGVIFADMADLDESQRKFLELYFQSDIYPVLTPMAVDQRHPFPMLLNANLYLVVRLAAVRQRMVNGAGIGAGAAQARGGAGHLRPLSALAGPAPTADAGAPAGGTGNGAAGAAGPSFAFVQVPSVLPRVVEVPGPKDTRTFVFLEDIIRAHMGALFQGYRVLSAYSLRVTRDADLTLSEEDSEDLLKAIEYELKRRPRGAAVRMEITKSAPASLVARIQRALNLSAGDVYAIDGPLDLKPLLRLAGSIDRPDMKETVFPPVPALPGVDKADIFKRISRGDILVHVPYQSFDIVQDFLDAAADDPEVLAIKQTLYRITHDSPVAKALARAAENGKEVTVLVELKARFDEETNIGLAKMLEEAGAHVIYGLLGLKTHCKAALVVRREPQGLKRYMHLSTGNYNEVTARIYSDMGLLTADEEFGADASALFNVITGYSEPTAFRKFVAAPFGMRDRIVRLINRERDRAAAGITGRIVAKMNSLVDKTVIDALYEASRAGVRIDLIVRGICCLRPGVKGISDNIRVTSIVDRFLEHGRIFYFYNGSQEEYYLSSADWMPRNLDRRIELMFPIQDAALRARLREIIDVQLTDTVKARRLQPDGTYLRVRGKKAVRSQVELYAGIRRRFKAAKGKESVPRKLTPLKAPEK